MRALVTGGTAGIGLAIAERLRLGGAKVDTPSRRNGYDFTLPEAVAAVKRDFETPDILINNVGGGGRWGPEEAENCAERVWEEVYRKNAATAAYLTAWALPTMMARGWGRVVTIASLHGREAGGRPWFMAAKAAQIAMMKAFSKDQRFVRCGITFNTVAPGHIWVSGKPEVDMAATPMGRMGFAEEVAAAVCFLCSREAGFINGACMTVDGGEGNAM